MIRLDQMRKQPGPIPDPRIVVNYHQIVRVLVRGCPECGNTDNHKMYTRREETSRMPFFIKCNGCKKAWSL
jgi:DNA-directed RNA polymerase subunit M/transcription elongation factor TFIIS